MTADASVTPEKRQQAGGPPTPETPRYPRPPVTWEEAEWVWRELAGQAVRPGAKPELARLAVIAGLVRATGARYGDLIRLRVEDLDLGPDTAKAGEGIATVRHGKHRVVRRHLLDPKTVVLLRHWMSVREELAVGLEGSVPRALLLTVHHTHDNGTTVSSGLPITRQGLVLSWRRWVYRTNALYGATRPPLPTRFEQVRRAWTETGDPQG